MRLAPGKTFAGKFLLEEKFASGGMGAMWRARDTQRNIPVAIKVMSVSVSDSPGFAVRFEREAKLAAQLPSPHVVSIFEYGVHQNVPYIVMELLEGEDLQVRLHREKRLSPRSTARIVRGVCEALHGAHESEIVHRDLKPANVFLVRAGANWTVKVLDFGIAKINQDEEGRITATGQMIGTPHYMSPEQIQAAKHVDHRADLWAVTAIAFRALTGQMPFPGHTVAAIRAILYETAPAPSSIRPDISPALDAFFARALARDINARYQSARELSDALVKAVGRDAMKRPDSDDDELTPSSVMLADLGLSPMSSRDGLPWSVRVPESQAPPANSSMRPGPLSDAPNPLSSPPSSIPPSLPPSTPPDSLPSKSIRPPVSLSAPLLPVMLPPRESRPMSEPTSRGSTPSTEPRTPSVPSTPPSLVPPSYSRPTSGRPWLLWLAAATMLILVGAFLALMATSC